VGEGIYRDAFVGLRARIAELDTRILDLERRMSIDLAEHLPADLVGEMTELRERWRAEAHTLEELTRAEAAGATYAELLLDALAMAPEIETELCTLPSDPPELGRFGRKRWQLRFTSGSAMSEVLTTVGAVLARVVARHDPLAKIEPLEDFAFAARLHASNSPIALLVECFVDPERLYEPRVQVATSIARAVRRFALLPETWGRELLRAMGLRTSIETGDEDFDGRFLVEGDARTARTILSVPVRASLLAIARDDVPELRVDSGAAILSWSFEPTERALDAAFFVLGRIRAAEVPLRLTST